LGKMWTLDVTHNPGLSIKDVMAWSMLKEAMKTGLVSDETWIVEGTSGNTGAGLAIVAVHMGLHCLLIIPDKMSQEKIDRLRNLGSHVIVSPTKVDADDPKSYYMVRDYCTQKLGGWRANQYDNLANRQAHYEITGPEIWEQTKGKVTAVVSTAGTCGTVSGIGEYLKAKNPAIKMIAVDTIGSILYLLKEGYTIDQLQQYARGYTIQGFGEDIHPQNLDLDVVDRFVRVGDVSGLNMARLLPSLGFFPGQSSGAAYTAVLELLDEGYLGESDQVVTIFPDHGMPYRRDVYNLSWMKEKGFM
jgi:cystathionine beta-synthase